MNSLTSYRIVTLLLLALMGLGAGACGDTACEELGEWCPNCADRTYYDSCRKLVEDEIDDVCDTQMSTFQMVCPPPSSSQ